MPATNMYWSKTRDAFHRAWQRWYGFWGSLFIVAAAALKLIQFGGDMDFIAQHWPAIRDFMQVWGVLILLAVGIFMVVKAIHESTEPAASIPATTLEAQKPFLVRFPEKSQDCIGSVTEHGWKLLNIEVVNAIAQPLSDVEVFISGETNSIGTAQRRRVKIGKVHLRSRRGVTNFKAGQSEEYVLVSRNLDDGELFWGDHMLLGTAERQHLEDSCAQHFLEVTVLSQEQQRFIQKNAGYHNR